MHELKSECCNLFNQCELRIPGRSTDLATCIEGVKPNINTRSSYQGDSLSQLSCMFDMHIRIACKFPNDLLQLLRVLPAKHILHHDVVL